MGIFSFFKLKKEKEKPLNKKVKIGLALGGGGARGFAHIGVIKALEEAGFKFDFVAGTSAGSIVGAMYCAGKTSDEMIEIAKTIKEKDIRTSKILIVPSKTTGIENLIKNNIGDIDISELKIPFAPVVVDIKSTEELALRRGNLAKAVAGSCAVPGVFTPVEFDERLFSDGGLQNTIPADVPKKFGCDYVLAVDVNSTRAYGTDSDKIIDVMAASIRILMKSNAIKGYVYGEVIVQPHLKQYKSTKMNGFMEMIEEGYRATKELLPDIRELFTRKPRKKKTVVPFDENLIVPNDYDINMVRVDKNNEQAEER